MMKKLHKLRKDNNLQRSGNKDLKRIDTQLLIDHLKYDNGKTTK